jgi:hypothetical protein
MNQTELVNRFSESALQEELRFFADHEQEWAAQHRGEFVLIGKQTFAGFHKSYEDAMRAGVRAFGPVAPFLVRQIHTKTQ